MSDSTPWESLEEVRRRLLESRPKPDTCDDGWHVCRSGHKRCDCGEMTNPAYRNWWRRWNDRRKFHKGKHICSDPSCHGFRDNRMD